MRSMTLGQSSGWIWPSVDSIRPQVISTCGMHVTVLVALTSTNAKITEFIPNKFICTIGVYV